jgi:hypothetical protein
MLEAFTNLAVVLAASLITATVGLLWSASKTLERVSVRLDGHEKRLDKLEGRLDEAA